MERATPVEVADPAPVNAAGPVEAPPSTEPEGLVLPIAPEGIDDDGWLLPPPVAAPTVATDDSFVEELRSFAQSLQTPAHTAPSEPPSPDEVAKAPAVEAPKAAETVSATNKASIGKDSATVDSEPSDRVISDEELLPAEPSFVRQAKRRAFWRSRGVRIGLNLVSLVLGLGLLAQVAVHQRDALAARFPTLMPVLAGLCQPLACELGPARQIESVVIDSSTLVRRLGSFYSFDLVLRNSARIPVAMPALELSLTDTRDAVIARRVFLPDELPGEHQLLPASGNLSLSLRLYIAEQGVSSMSGYRALVFYP